MSEMQSTLDRLETRIDHQAARIDALYRLLKLRGILPEPPENGTGDAFCDELVQIEDSPLAREVHRQSARRPTARLHVGNATGV